MKNPFNFNKLKTPLNISEKEKMSEKTQEELRTSLEKRLLDMKGTVQEAMEEYKQALKDELFEDKESEAEGEGDKRKNTMQAKITVLFDRAEKMKARLDSKEKLSNIIESLSVTYTHPDGKVEHISFSLEEKLEEYIAFYEKTKMGVPSDFEDKIEEIWENNNDEIQKSIEQHGFNNMLIIPGNTPLEELNTYMTEGYNATYQSSNFTSGGSFAGAKSNNVDKPRIVLVHKTQNLEDRPELAETLNIKGQDVNQDKTLTLEDYLIFQRKYFEETGKHLDEKGWTWLATKSASRLVDAGWNPSDGQLSVLASGLDDQDPNRGARPSRSFF